MSQSVGDCSMLPHGLSISTKRAMKKLWPKTTEMQSPLASKSLYTNPSTNFPY